LEQQNSIKSRSGCAPHSCIRLAQHVRMREGIMVMANAKNLLLDATRRFLELRGA
jgi:hypothetical protein